MRNYYIAVETPDAGNRNSILREFQSAAQKAFHGAGLAFTEVRDQLLISCPNRDVREQVRDFVKARSDVREPVVPPAQTF